MFPDQQNQGGVNSAPQQAPNGQYEVVPPLPVANNVGHSGHNPYEFIVNPNTPKHSRSLFGGGKGDSFLMKIGLVVGGVVLLMIVAAVIISALGPKSIKPQLLAIAERQQEIVRVATEASQQTTSQSAKNFVANVTVSISSSQQQMLAYLQTHDNTKPSAKVLALDQSSQTDTLLSNAASANNSDSVITQTLSSELQTYEGLLQTAFKQTSNVSTKQLLQSSYAGASALLKQAQASSTSSN